MNAASKDSMEVASLILTQLGGNRFITMTGARHLAGDANSLQFKLPGNFAKDGINSVRVVLAPDDTYSLQFHKLGRAPNFSVKLVEELDGVYAEDLRRIFTSVTGLEVKL